MLHWQSFLGLGPAASGPGLGLGTGAQERREPLEPQVRDGGAPQGGEEESAEAEATGRESRDKGSTLLSLVLCYGGEIYVT